MRSGRPSHRRPGHRSCPAGVRLRLVPFNASSQRIARIKAELSDGKKSGERRFAKRLEDFLEDDYLCWYDVPIGPKRHHPDFLILHPSRGLLYDDARSICRKSRGLDFSLSSVGIKAAGRTSILRLNYRNTREILQFACDFASQFLDAQAADDDQIPMVLPETGGASGPAFRQFESIGDEIAYATKCLKAWHERGDFPSDIAVICMKPDHGKRIAKRLEWNARNSTEGDSLRKTSFKFRDLLTNEPKKIRWLHGHSRSSPTSNPVFQDRSRQ